VSRSHGDKKHVDTSWSFGFLEPTGMSKECSSFKISALGLLAHADEDVDDAE